jgi:hypothetical protein
LARSGHAGAGRPESSAYRMPTLWSAVAMCDQSWPDSSISGQARACSSNSETVRISPQWTRNLIGFFHEPSPSRTAAFVPRLLAPIPGISKLRRLARLSRNAPTQRDAHKPFPPRGSKRDPRDHQGAGHPRRAVAFRHSAGNHDRKVRSPVARAILRARQVV